MQDLTLVQKIHFFKDSKGNCLEHIMIVIIKYLVQLLAITSSFFFIPVIPRTQDIGNLKFSCMMT